MSEQIRPTWEERDLPILEACAVMLQELPFHERRRGIRISGVEGFIQDDVGEALWVLYEAGYIEAITSKVRRQAIVVLDLTERGRRAVGQWPSEDAGANLLRAIEARIAEAPDDPDTGHLKRVRDELVSIGSGTLTGIATAVIRSGLGI